MPANTPKYALPYPLPSEPVAEGAQAIRNLAEGVEARIAPYVGTTPPASPFHGQLWLYPNGALSWGPTYAGGAAWLFMYDANEVSPYKWKFVGGAPFVATDDVNKTASVSTAWTSPYAGDAYLDVPRAGDYLYEYGATCYSTTGGVVWLGLRVGTSDPQQDGYRCTAGQTGTSQRMSLSRSGLVTCAAADRLTLRYLSSAAMSLLRYGAHISVIPIRVA